MAPQKMTTFKHNLSNLAIMTFNLLLISSELQILRLHSKNVISPFENCCSDTEDTYKLSYRIQVGPLVKLNKLNV